MLSEEQFDKVERICANCKWCYFDDSTYRYSPLAGLSNVKGTYFCCHEPPQALAIDHFPPTNYPVVFPFLVCSKWEPSV